MYDCNLPVQVAQVHAALLSGKTWTLSATGKARVTGAPIGVHVLCLGG